MLFSRLTVYFHLRRVEKMRMSTFPFWPQEFNLSNYAANGLRKSHNNNTTNHTTAVYEIVAKCRNDISTYLLSVCRYVYVYVC